MTRVYIFLALALVLLFFSVMREPPVSTIASDENNATIIPISSLATPPVAQAAATSPIASAEVDKRLVNGNESITVTITSGTTVNHTYQLFLEGNKIGTTGTGNNLDTITITLTKSQLKPYADRGDLPLSVLATKDDAQIQTHPAGDIRIDTRGPEIRDVRLVGTPDTVPRLEVTFRDNDLKPSTVAPSSGNLSNVKVQKLDSLGSLVGSPITIPHTNVSFGDKLVARISLPNLTTGTYRFEATGITDEAGNTSIPVKLVWDFNSFPEQPTQPAVEFPQALQAKETEHTKRANPGDFVETRVARLYYFRDAHRVAQIINRRTKSYNGAAVTAAQQRYQTVRDNYELATEKRRKKESEAVQTSQNRQILERQINEQLRYINSLNERIASRPVPATAPAADAGSGGDGGAGGAGAIGGAGGDGGSGGTPAPENGDNVNPGEANSLEEIRTKANEHLSTLQNQLTQARAAENQAKIQIEDLQATEDRLAKREFEARVNELSTDPNTYAPASTDSVDPVAMVSISVIGEGVLHLRGPITGINKIRMMINQIDTPLGQVKVGINTVQINGEDERKMEKVAGIVEGHIGLGRHLTMQSLRMLRRAVVEVAGQVASESENMGHYQIDRDRKYLYSFFGRDFIDELYEMDSEFLRTENKLLSLHSMDTVSLNRALFIFALARNDIRDRILNQFLQLTQCDLPVAEWEYRRQSELFPHRTRLVLPFKRRDKLELDTLEKVQLNAQQRYMFANLKAFFANENLTPDTINPMQRTFIRLAQIFKSQLVAEMEVKQRIIERFVIEDEREKSFSEEATEQTRIRKLANTASQKATDKAVKLLEQYFSIATTTRDGVSFFEDEERKIKATICNIKDFSNEFVKLTGARDNKITASNFTPEKIQQIANNIQYVTWNTKELLQFMKELSVFDRNQDDIRLYLIGRIEKYLAFSAKRLEAINELARDGNNVDKRLTAILEDHIHFGTKDLPALDAFLKLHDTNISLIVLKTKEYLEQSQITSPDTDLDEEELATLFAQIMGFRNGFLRTSGNTKETEIRVATFFSNIQTLHDLLQDLHISQNERRFWHQTVSSHRTPLDKKKLLDHLIEEKTEKYVELLEGTRSHISVVDNYLKRLAMALEDDFKVQFYDPSFNRIRRAAASCAVTLGQVERTNVLMNNRSLAVVQPTATMEFNLPHRDIFIVEAMDNARTLVQEYGGLLKDPTFLAAFDMFGGAKNGEKVVNALPSLSSMNNEYSMGLTDSDEGGLGSGLQGRVPDPAIYKFETGTGFEIRPVIQPDGDSIVYDFHYMYTTNIREPVNPNEKHLGRVKRHFVNTQVQTSSFAMREISRYQVALKASRTAKGVPGLDNIPVVGALFKPAPSADSSLQQNVILGQTTIYPTLFDLMGLRWAKHVVDLDHANLRDHDMIVRGRYDTINDTVFQSTSQFVDEFLDVKRKNPSNDRPDLYHQNRVPTPYHPNGYIYEDGALKMTDPTGNEFRVRDRRPPEWRQEPPYDPRFRRPVRYDDSIPGGTGIPMQSPELIEPQSQNQRSYRGRSGMIRPRGVSTRPSQIGGELSASRNMSMESLPPIPTGKIYPAQQAGHVEPANRYR